MVEHSGSAPRAHQRALVHCYKAMESEQMLSVLLAFEHIL